MKLYRRVLSHLVLVLTATACNAARKTAPIAPSGAIAACSARELASTLWLEKADELKIKHGITIGSEIGGTATLGYEKGGVSAEASISGNITREKASEVEIDLPDAELCPRLGYVPQLGRWSASEFLDQGQAIAELTDHTKRSEVTTVINELDGDACVWSDAYNCLCRLQHGMEKRSCTASKHRKQTRNLVRAVYFAVIDAEAAKNRQEEYKAKTKDLTDCLAKCTCDIGQTAAASTDPPAKLSDAVLKARADCCANSCKQKHKEREAAEKSSQRGQAEAVPAAPAPRRPPGT